MSIVKDDKSIIRAWTFYDWANSVFPLVISSAIFPNFYEYITSHDAADNFTGDKVTVMGMTVQNTTIYSFMYSFALAIVVLIAPMLSGIADYLGNKKRFLQFFCYLGSLSCMALFFFSSENLGLSFIPFVTATVGFWGSLVYYNSYLPQIASEANQDKVSARGFALGYFGSALLLIICLIGITFFQYDKETGEGFFKIQYAFLLTGIWWLGFAQYTFSKLPNSTGAKEKDGKNILTKGFGEIAKVAGEVIKLRTLKRFLSAYFFYNMGVQTVMVVAVLFARKEVEWPDEATKTSSLIISILLIQFVGIGGAFLFSFISKKTGNIRALLIAIAIWIFICVFTYTTVHTPGQFYIVAVMVGLVMGGIQALSRSTYSKFLPPTNDHASFFSFYDVMEKLGMIIGTSSFGFIAEISGGMRNSVLALIVFFVVGFVLLLFVPRKSFL